MEKVKSIPEMIRELEKLRANADRRGLVEAKRENETGASYWNGLETGYRVAINMLKGE